MMFLNKNNVLLISIFLLFLCMSTVCASDITVTNVTNDNNINNYSINQINEINEIQVNDSSIESVTNENTKLVNLVTNPSESNEKQEMNNKNNNPTSNLKILNEIIHNAKDNTIVLDNDYKYSGKDDLHEAITLKSNLVIDGQGHTIDGAGVAHIFNIADNVTIKNLIFKNTHSGCGGAIYWNGINGIVNNCTFINSTARYLGGAIEWHGPNGTISNCTFQDNTAEYAGALYLVGDVNVLNSTFKNNTCTYRGGAIYYCADSIGSVINCNFINCNNTKDNKAIDVRSNILIENCTYDNPSKSNEVNNTSSFIINIANATGVDGVLLNGTVDVSVGGKVYSFNVTDGSGYLIVNDTLSCGNYSVNASL